MDLHVTFNFWKFFLFGKFFGQQFMGYLVEINICSETFSNIIVFYFIFEDYVHFRTLRKECAQNADFARKIARFFHSARNLTLNVRKIVFSLN